MEVNIRKMRFSRKNSNIATWILLVFTVGFFISYPFHYNFIGGLVSSLCGAAMIGGLADWFAVVALFRKPLNSNLLAKLFRTEIISRNRDRIFKALVDMVEKELLTKETILEKFQNINPSKVYISLISSNSKNELRDILDISFKEISNSLSEEELKKLELYSAELMKSGIKNIAFSRLITNAAIRIWNGEFKEKITDEIALKLEELSKTYETRMLLGEVILQILELNRGNFLVMIIGFFIKSNLENISKTIQEKLVQYVADMKKSGTNERNKLQSFIDNKLNDFKNDYKLNKDIEAFKNEMLDNNADLLRRASRTLIDYITNIKNDRSNTTKIVNSIFSEIEDFAAELREDEGKQKRLNLKITNMFKQIVEANHYKIGYLVKDKLKSVSSDELVNMIEPIIGEDLQLIRVNGSLVGGLVGVITYLLTFWIN